MHDGLLLFVWKVALGFYRTIAFATLVIFTLSTLLFIYLPKRIFERFEKCPIGLDHPDQIESQDHNKTVEIETSLWLNNLVQAIFTSKDQNVSSAITMIFKRIVEEKLAAVSLMTKGYISEVKIDDISCDIEKLKVKSIESTSSPDTLHLAVDLEYKDVIKIKAKGRGGLKVGPITCTLQVSPFREKIYLQLSKNLSPRISFLILRLPFIRCSFSRGPSLLEKLAALANSCLLNFLKAQILYPNYSSLLLRTQALKIDELFVFPFGRSSRPFTSIEIKSFTLDRELLSQIKKSLAIISLSIDNAQVKFGQLEFSDSAVKPPRLRLVVPIESDDIASQTANISISYKRHRLARASNSFEGTIPLSDMPVNVLSLITIQASNETTFTLEILKHSEALRVKDPKDNWPLIQDVDNIDSGQFELGDGFSWTNIKSVWSEFVRQKKEKTLKKDLVNQELGSIAQSLEDTKLEEDEQAIIQELITDSLTSIDSLTADSCFNVDIKAQDTLAKTIKSAGSFELLPKFNFGAEIGLFEKLDAGEILPQKDTVKPCFSLTGFNLEIIAEPSLLLFNSTPSTIAGTKDLALIRLRPEYLLVTDKRKKLLLVSDIRDLTSLLMQPAPVNINRDTKSWSVSFLTKKEKNTGYFALNVTDDNLIYFLNAWLTLLPPDQLEINIDKADNLIARSMDKDQFLLIVPASDQNIIDIPLIITADQLTQLQKIKFITFQDAIQVGREVVLKYKPNIMDMLPCLQPTILKCTLKRSLYFPGTLEFKEYGIQFSSTGLERSVEKSLFLQLEELGSLEMTLAWDNVKLDIKMAKGHGSLYEFCRFECEGADKIIANWCRLVNIEYILH